MNKATFVNEIPSKIEGNEVPTLNLVKSMIDKNSGLLSITRNGDAYITLCKKEPGQHFHGLIYINWYVAVIDIAVSSDGPVFGSFKHGAKNSSNSSCHNMELLLLTINETKYVGLKIDQGGLTYTWNFVVKNCSDIDNVKLCENVDNESSLNGGLHLIEDLDNSKNMNS